MSNQKKCASNPNDKFKNFASKQYTPNPRYILNLTVVTGYNLFTQNDFGTNIQVEPGYVLIVDNTRAGKISIWQTMGNITANRTDLYNDYFMSIGSTLTSTNNINSNYKYLLQIRAIVSPSYKVVSSFKTYSRLGVYNLSMTVMHNLLPDPIETINKTVIVIAGIENLTSFTNFQNACPLNIPCSLTAKVTAGDYIVYYWNTTIKNVKTNEPNVSITFTTLNTYLLHLVAVNPVSRRSFYLNITVYEPITNLTFYAGNSTQSASIIGQQAMFLFKIDTGTGYTCQIIYGDGYKQNFNVLDTDFNGTYFGHTFSSENVYQVSISCRNPVSSALTTINHYSQFKVDKVSLVKLGVLINTPYTVDFTFKTGSQPLSGVFYFDDALDTNLYITSFYGRGSPRPGEAKTAIHTVSIFLSNYASSKWLNGTFEISSPIINATFTISNFPFNSYMYVYPDPFNFVINMLMGSNVRVRVFYGDESNSNIPGSDWTFTGDWPGPYLFSHAYQNPGDYVIKVNVSNFINFYSTTKYISIVSGLDGLNCSLFQNPVIYKSTAAGIANFMFQFMGNTKAGSHSNVTLYAGDSSSIIYGPFILGMDFVNNINSNPISYVYNAIGIYTATLTVINPLGSKTFTLSVHVYEGIDGFYIDVVPKLIVVGASVTVNAYLMQGTGITYKWYLNGSLISSKSRTGKLIYYDA